MRIKNLFHRKTSAVNTLQESNSTKQFTGGDYGLHFPYLAIIALIMGIISEVTDIFVLRGTIGKFNTAIGNDAVDIISTITGILCYGSMATIGYQSANTRVKYRTKALEIGIWFFIGLLIACMRVFLTSISSVDSPMYQAKVSNDIFMAILQFGLYISSGFMSYFSAKQLTNGKYYEYYFAKRDYNKSIKQVANSRKFISGGIDDLESYLEYTKRLEASKEGVLKRVGDYNKATKALCAAKMAVETEPDDMDEMYEKVRAQEIKDNGRWATTA